MADEVLADLSMAVGETGGKSLRFRKQEQTRVFVGVGAEENRFGGLKILFAIANVEDTGSTVFVIGEDAQDVGACEDGEILRLDRKSVV